MSRILHRLIREESVAPCDIAVLSGHALERSVLGEGGKIGSFRCTQDQEADPDAVLLDSIYRFRGLERPVIVLVEVDGHVKHGTEEILYVGLSRARTYLAVVGTAETLGAVRVDTQENE